MDPINILIRIEAIRRVCEMTGLGLKEAKEFVDTRWP